MRVDDQRNYNDVRKKCIQYFHQSVIKENKYSRLPHRKVCIGSENYNCCRSRRLTAGPDCLFLRPIALSQLHHYSVTSPKFDSTDNSVR